MTPAANVALAPLTTLKIGGPAQWYAEALSAGDVAAAIAWATDRALPLFVLGGGSNLVVADRGLPGLVLHMRIRGVTFSDVRGETLVSAGAGEDWDAVVAATVARGLAGLECLSGIPGTVGATPVQNVGAYGQEVGRVIDHVEVVDMTERTVRRTLSAEECAFSYRMSRFKGSDADRFIVTRVVFRLAARAPTITYPDVVRYIEQRAIMSPGLDDVREAVIAIRRRKGMVIDPADPDTRSVGSFFINPLVSIDVHRSLTSKFGPVPSFPAAGQVKIPAAWLIERAGIARGFTRAAAAVSSKHPLALVSRPGAGARDVVALAVHIKRTVAERFGIALRPEPMLVGFGDDADVAYLRDAEVRSKPDTTKRSG